MDPVIVRLGLALVVLAIGAGIAIYLIPLTDDEYPTTLEPRLEKQLKDATSEPPITEPFPARISGNIRHGRASRAYSYGARTCLVGAAIVIAGIKVIQYLTVLIKGFGQGFSMGLLALLIVGLGAGVDYWFFGLLWSEGRNKKVADKNAPSPRTEPPGRDGGSEPW